MRVSLPDFPAGGLAVFAGVKLRAHAVPVLSVLLGVLAVPAQAQVRATTDYLERMDSDGDGRVSLEEYLVWMSYAFERMDRNGDGVLTADELPGGKGKPVSLSEYRARLTDRFNRQDTNRDGFLDARELAAPPH